MSKYLVIVESPTKEKTISKFLGPDFEVKSSYGHVRDLPKSKIGIDIENNYEPQYALMPKAKKVISSLKDFAKKSELIYLATDYDREGEAIAWHLKEALDLTDKKTRRITFHEITETALKDAVKNPRKIDANLVDSQQARRVLDRLVGYKLSPLLWKKIKYGLSAGRVQSVAVRMICDREDDIEKFKSEEYWSLSAELKKGSGAGFTADLFAVNDKKVEKLDIKNKDMADAIVKNLEKAVYKVDKLETKQQKRQPYAPYTTSTLQQDASRAIYFSAAKTMMIAQKLYEGIDIGKQGTVGLITYMRTDSLNVAESARTEAKNYIVSKFGKEFYPEKPRVYKTKSKGAQEAHEAIRPTSAKIEPEEIKKYLSPDEYKLYELIWRRFLSSQMADAVYDTQRADIKANEYTFRASGRTIKFSGFLEVYSYEDQDDKKDEKEAKLPLLSMGDVLTLIKLVPGQHFTEPPPRFNEASLIKALEEHGIGRPSTYAPIIKTIQDRSYVRLDARRFFPTQLGRLVNEALKAHFPGIVNVEFTANIEEKLDLVAEGKTAWVEVIDGFYKPFEVDLAKADVNMPRQKIKPETTDKVCPKCGKQMVLRDSRRGRFIACSGFPDCRTTFSIDKDNNIVERPKPEMTEEKCEKCGSPMVKRVGKRGPFLACSGFPKCRNIKKWKQENEQQ